MSHSMKEKPEWVRMGSFPKADPAYYPTVTVIERANTEELERQDSRPDLSKALPRKPAKQLFTRLGWLQFVGPNHSTRPHELTILLSLFVLIAFVVILSLAAKFPVKGVLITFVSISGLGILGLFGTVIVDLVIRGGRMYSRNLGNTALTVLITIPFMTILYCLVWYPSLNKTVLEVTSDTVNQAEFPAVALFQRVDWASQANILPANYTKCFLGWLVDTKDTPTCTDLAPEELIPGKSCNCSESWSSTIDENFIWQNTTYRSLSFNPSTSLASGVPTYSMTLQAFFDYNATASLKTSSQEQSPSLYMAIHDPRLHITEALQKGYTRMVLINANADNSINLGLRVRQALGFAPAYDYDLTITQNSNLDLVCNTGSNNSYPCHVTLFIQIPTFERTIILQQNAMSWLDVAASAGGYYSFVQFLSWILSGQAGAS